MYPIAHLGPKDVVYQAVLGDPRQAMERRRSHHRVEVVPVAADLSARTRNARLDPPLQFLGGSRHVPSVAPPGPWLYSVKQ
jgi:hypothetical protein